MARQYLVHPGSLYPGEPYPFTVPGVESDVTEVVSPAGSVWERADEEMLTTAALSIINATTAVGSQLEIPIDRLRESESTLQVDVGVVRELWSRVMHGSAADFAEISADLVGANSIRGGHIAAGALDGKIITGATVRTAAEGARVEMTGSGLTAYNEYGQPTVEINGQQAVITAGTMRTSSSGTRTEMSTEDGLRVLYGGDVYFQAHHSLPYGFAVREPSTGVLRSPSSIIFGPRALSFTTHRQCTSIDASAAGVWNTWDLSTGGCYLAETTRAVVVTTISQENRWGVPVRVVANLRAGTSDTVDPGSDVTRVNVADTGAMKPLGPYTTDTQALAYTLSSGVCTQTSVSSAQLVELVPGTYYWPSLRCQCRNTSAQPDSTVAPSITFGPATITIIPC